MALSKVSITGRTGDLSVDIDGTTVTPREVGVRFDQNSVPVVTLGLAADTTLELDAVVHLMREPTHEDIAAVAANVLRNVDSDGVRQLVQQRLRTLRDDPIAKTIEVLAELVQEDPHGGPQ